MRSGRRSSMGNNSKWILITTLLLLLTAILILLLLPRTCTKNHNFVIVGPTQVSAESANFLLLYEDNQPVQNVYWNILEGSQYAFINHVTGELTINQNANNSTITIQGIYNDQYSTFNVIGTYVKGVVINTKINSKTSEPIIVYDFASDTGKLKPVCPDPTDTKKTSIPDPVPYITPSPAPSPIPGGQPPTFTHNDGKGKLTITISALVGLLISYIIAKIKSKNGELVITANTVDKLLIIISPVLFFIAWCPGIDHELYAFQITLFTLSGLLLQGSIIFSIVANKGNAMNTSLSIMAKLFIFAMTVFLLLLYITILIAKFMLSVMSHSHHEGTFVVKYDHFLDQWVGYRID